MIYDHLLVDLHGCHHIHHHHLRRCCEGCHLQPIRRFRGHGHRDERHPRKVACFPALETRWLRKKTRLSVAAASRWTRIPQASPSRPRTRRRREARPLLPRRSRTGGREATASRSSPTLEPCNPSWSIGRRFCGDRKNPDFRLRGRCSRRVCCQPIAQRPFRANHASAFLFCSGGFWIVKNLSSDGGAPSPGGRFLSCSSLILLSARS